MIENIFCFVNKVSKKTFWFLYCIKKLFFVVLCDKMKVVKKGEIEMEKRIAELLGNALSFKGISLKFENQEEVLDLDLLVASNQANVLVNNHSLQQHIILHFIKTSLEEGTLSFDFSAMEKCQLKCLHQMLGLNPSL